MTESMISKLQGERLCAWSYPMMLVLRGFVRNRRDIHTEEPFTGPLSRLMDEAERVLEQIGPIEDDRIVTFRKPVDLTVGKLVIVESPFAGEVVVNVAYARQACRDCLLRGEHPIASHLLYTQPGILDDNDPDERERGIAAGLAWRKAAQKAVFYTGRGWSRGMLAAKEVYDREGFPYEVRDMPALPATGTPFPQTGLSDDTVAVDLSDIPEVPEGWFDGARLVLPDEVASPGS